MSLAGLILCAYALAGAAICWTYELIWPRQPFMPNQQKLFIASVWIAAVVGIALATSAD